MHRRLQVERLRRDEDARREDAERRRQESVKQEHKESEERRKELIAHVVEQEEVRFRETIERGLSILQNGYFYQSVAIKQSEFVGVLDML